MKNNRTVLLLLGTATILLLFAGGCDPTSNPSPGTITVDFSGNRIYVGGLLIIEVYSEGGRPAGAGPAPAPLGGDTDTVTVEGAAVVTARTVTGAPVLFPAGNYDISVFMDRDNNGLNEGEGDLEYLDTISIDGNRNINITPGDMSPYTVPAH